MKMLLGGQRVDSTTGRTYEIRNPATGEVIDTVPQAGPEDVARALAFARKGKVTMAALPAHRRSEILKRSAELIQQHFDCLLRLLISENALAKEAALLHRHHLHAGRQLQAQRRAAQWRGRVDAQGGREGIAGLRFRRAGPRNAGGRRAGDLGRRLQPGPPCRGR